MISYLQDGAAPQEGALYFLDANVWMYIINPPPKPSVSGQPYVDFFAAIVNLANNNRCKIKPKIYVNVLLLTEVVNALLRAHLKARNDSSADEINFKTYRKQQHYRNNLKAIKDDFEIYRSYLEEDVQLGVDGLELLKEMPPEADYNDYIYTKIVTERDLILVTHDVDFKTAGVKIVTANKKIR